MKLETSEDERAEWKAHGGAEGSLLRRLHRDIDTLLAEVERLRTERRPFSDGLAQKVIDEQVKTIDRLTAKLATPPTPPLPAEVEEMRSELDLTAKMLRTQAAECFPEINEAGQKHFVRVVMESAAEAIDPILILLSRWPGVWKPIETAPKDGTKILLGKIVGHPESPTALWWATKGFWSSKWNNWNDGIEPAGLAGPTHWADLPAMPPPGAAP